jgi:hypothetical protein
MLPGCKHSSKASLSDLGQTQSRPFSQRRSAGPRWAARLLCRGMIFAGGQSFADGVENPDHMWNGEDGDDARMGTGRHLRPRYPDCGKGLGRRLCAAVWRAPQPENFRCIGGWVKIIGTWPHIPGMSGFRLIIKVSCC